MSRQQNTKHRELSYSVSDQKLKCYTIKLRNYRTQNSHFHQLLVFVIQNQQTVMCCISICKILFYRQGYYGFQSKEAMILFCTVQNIQNIMCKQFRDLSPNFIIAKNCTIRENSIYNNHTCPIASYRKQHEQSNTLYVT